MAVRRAWTQLAASAFTVRTGPCVERVRRRDNASMPQEVRVRLTVGGTA